MTFQIREGYKKSSKGLKVLSAKSFYLDISNTAVHSRVEKQLKSLGATVEVFLEDFVQYVVTDRTDITQPQQLSPATPAASPWLSVTPPSSSTNGLGHRKSLSRGEAMLEKVRHQPHQISADPLKNAKKWRIPICALQDTLEWLEKLSQERRQERDSVGHRNRRRLQSPYIKLEIRGARPEFIELGQFPSINVNTAPGTSPFQTAPSRNNDIKRERMTRKGRNCDPEPGYCELCCAEYSELGRHVVSATHRKSATNPQAYAALETLMAPPLWSSPVGSGGGRRSSVRTAPGLTLAMGNRQSSTPEERPPTPVSPRGGLTSSTPLTNGHTTRSSAGLRQSIEAGSLLEVQCNGTGNHCHFTRTSARSDNARDFPGLSHRTRTISASCPSTATVGEISQLSPTGSDSACHQLRSRKQMWLPPSLMGTTAEDEGNPARRLPNERPVSPTRDASVLSGKRKKVHRKRLSAEEKLIEDNKAYYKVEVLNSKLRSTGYYISQRELELSRMNGDDSKVTGGHYIEKECKSEKEPVVVRFKKVRKTELSLLSDEAESFMFGESVRRESDNDSEEDDDDRKLKRDDADDNSLGSSGSSSNTKRKRRTHAEAFIHDNLDYYKFDMPGSRLRFHGSIFPHISECKSEVNGEGTKEANDSVVGNCVIEKKEEAREEAITRVEEKEVTADEKERDREEEKGREEASTGGVADTTNVEALHFSFETIPQGETWYTTYRRQDECKEIYYPAYSAYPKYHLPYEFPSSEIRALSNGDKAMLGRRRKNHCGIVGADDKPRKSPRCHASTLAILSSLMRRRPRDSPEKKPESVPTLPQDDETRSSVTETVTSSDMKDSVIEVEPFSEVIESIDLPHASTVERKESIIDEQRSSEAKPNVADTMSLEMKLNVADTLPLEVKHNNVDHRQLEQSVDDMLTGVCAEATDDRYGQIVRAIIKCWCEDVGKSKRLPAGHTSIEWGEMCLDVDSGVVEHGIDCCHCPPGPNADLLTLVDDFRQCTSMERSDYHHLNPRNLDVLKTICVDASCNSSDCGNSSVCDLVGFTEDGRMISKKRKRKKRNLTGWPLGRKRKLPNKLGASSEGEKDDSEQQESEIDIEQIKDRSEKIIEKIKDRSEIKVDRKKGSCDASVKDIAFINKKRFRKGVIPVLVQEVSRDDERQFEVSCSISDKRVAGEPVRRGAAIERTSSLDSSCEPCLVRLQKIPEEPHDLAEFTRQLRSSSSPARKVKTSPRKKSPSRSVVTRDKKRGRVRWPSGRKVR